MEQFFDFGLRCFVPFSINKIKKVVEKSFWVESLKTLRLSCSSKTSFIPKYQYKVPFETKRLNYKTSTEHKTWDIKKTLKWLTRNMKLWKIKHKTYFIEDENSSNWTSLSILWKSWVSTINQGIVRRESGSCYRSRYLVLALLHNIVWNEENWEIATNSQRFLKIPWGIPNNFRKFLFSF